MKTNISLSGLAGSGKSTVGKMLASKLNYAFMSIGNYTREYAKETLNMDINAFQNYCKENPKTDFYIDKAFSETTNSMSHCIIDYRLAYKFIHNCFHVFLLVSEKEAVKRISAANRKDEFANNSFSEIEKTLNKRNELMRNRFIENYNTDFTDVSNYDLLVNTEEFETTQEIVEFIIKNLKSNYN
jgi:predicted cytidylate kinase